MNEVLITDLVSQQALDQLDALDRKMEDTLGQFKDCAMELAKGLKIPVEVTGDLDKLKDLANATMQRAGQAAQQYTQTLQQQQQVIANTTNTISRQLMEQEKLNKAQREAFSQDQRAIDVARDILGTYNQNAVQLAEYTEALRRNKEQQKELDKNRKAGLISEHDYLRVSAALLAEQNKLKTAHQEVASVLRIQAKEANAAEGSYAKLSQQLELMKKAQKNLNESEKSGEQGRLLETEIQNLDARLKDLAADMGEFQRNVGNYAIAQGGLKKSYGELQEVLTGLTIQYREMDDAQRESEEGQALKEQIDALTAKAATFRAAMEEVNAAVANSAAGQQITRLTFELTAMANEYGRMSDAEKESARGKELSQKMTDLTQKIATLKGEVDAVAADAAPQSIRKDLKEMTMEIAACTLEYEHMTAAEKESAAGQELKQKIEEMTEKAGELKDVLGDVKESISNSASDTRTWDTLNEAGQVTASVFGLCATAAQAFGVSEESLQASMLKVQQAMQAVQALQVIQNATQKQSNLMKGIAIIQSKAAAAAARIEAAATTQATGATVAQTAAMKVFNAVAKANPYVLLATAILTVIGLIIGYTAATKEATKADEAAKKAAEERKASQESMASSFGNTAGEMIAKYKLMREQWNALAGDVKAKQQYLKEHKSDFDNLAQAVDGAKSKMKGIDDVEKLVNKNTDVVVEAIKRRAKAMAAYAEYIRLTQKELEELENLSTYKYRNFHAGNVVSTKELDAAGVDYSAGLNPFKQKLVVEIDEEQAKKLTEWSRRTNLEDNRKAREEITKRYDELKKYAFQEAKDNGAFEAASFRGGDYGTTGSKSGGSKGGSNKSTGKDQVKDYEALRDEIDKILLESYKKEEDFTQDWYEAQTAAIKKQAEVEQRANAERAKKLEEELEKSKKADKKNQEQYDEELIQLRNATVEIDKNIEAKKVADLEALDEKMFKHQVENLAKATAAEQALADAAYQKEIARMYEEYTEAIRLANERGEDITKINESFNRRKEAADNEYANATVQRNIEMMKKELEVSYISEDEREKLQQELTKATAELAQQGAEQEKKHIEDVVEADKTAKEKRQQNLQDWVQKAGEAFQKIGDFMTAMYDNQIAKIEELLEAEQERYDQQVEQIEYLAERGAITSEEAEIRKREAATATEKKQEELEKRKSQLEYKKAVTEKVNSVSQAAISTALGIMSALAQFPGPVGWALAAAVGAMGAIQIATILAQPIKAYKEGTRGKPHPGGLALVGEGGSQELVMYNGKAWVTPDEPTLIDLPRGAEVFPDATAKDLLSLGASLPMAVPRDRRTGQPIIINDYSALESRMAANTKAVTKALNQFSDRMARELKRQKFNAYIASRI